MIAALPARFTNRITLVDGRLDTPCHVWTGAKDRKGYGKFWWNGKTVKTHKLAFELKVRVLDAHEKLDHLCRVRACCNELHLEPVSNKVNTLRGESPTAKHARKTHCPKGHAYDSANTLVYVGKRYCRACHRERRRK
jgi:hypothetical protein